MDKERRPVYTQCPGCGTVFKVHAWQLRKAGGRVGCGLCHATFDALEQLSDQLPDALAAEAKAPLLDAQPEVAAPAPGNEQPMAEPGPAAPEPEEVPGYPEPEILTEAAVEPVSGVRPEADAEPMEWDDGEPEGPHRREPSVADGDDSTQELFEQWSADGVDFTRTARGGEGDGPEKQSRKRGGGFLWGMLAGLLILALAVQGTYLYRDELAREPALRGWVEWVCSVLGCTVAPPSRLDALEIRERWMEPHPHREGFLLVGAVLVNGAAYPQAYPEVRILLRDIEGNVVADRWYPPQAYLDDSRLRTRLEAGMPVGQGVPLRLDIQGPEGGAESFQLEFRAPR